jgi:small subunit ribosomal protein S3
MAGKAKTERRKDKRIIVENMRRVLLKEYLMKETRRAGFGGLDIQRTPMGTRVTLLAERPGLVIGRKGGAIKGLTEAVERQFKFDNPQIEVQEVGNPSLNAQIMAEKLANALERGWHFRRAGHSTIRRIMEAGGKGALVIIAGKLTGQRHRTEKFKAGHIKYCGEPRYQWMDRGFAVAKLKPGVIGVTVEIMNPAAKLPDEIEIRAPVPGAEAAPGAPVLGEEVPEAAGAEEVPFEPKPGAPAIPETAPVSSGTAEGEEAVVLPEEEPAKEKVIVKKSKVAAKRLKKVVKEVKQLGVDVDVDEDAGAK